MLGQVAIVGVAQTSGAAGNGRTLEECIHDTVREVLGRAGVTHEALDTIVAASSDQVDGRAISIMLTSGALGGYGKDVLDTPSAGEHALVLAWLRLLTGAYHAALVVSWSGLEVNDLRTVQNLSCDPIFHRQLGLHDLASHGLQAGAYQSRYGVDARAAAQVAAKNRAAGARNPLATLRTPVSAEEVLDSPVVAWPLRELMLPPDSAGVVALVLVSGERAAELGRRGAGRAAWLRGVGWSLDSYWLGQRNLAELTSLRSAAQRAYAMAGLRQPLAELDVAELHDVTAYHELMAYEALGFCAAGEGARLIAEGRTGPDGALPCNPSGGSLSDNPYFATGLVRVAEAARQVTGQAGACQVPGARLALAHASSGFAAQGNSVFILSGEAD